MIDQVLLELLSEFGTKSLDVFNLLGDLAADLDDLLVDVPGEEVCTLGRVMRCVLHILDQLLHGLVRQVLHSGDLHHHILDQVLNEHLGFLVGRET